MQKIGLYSSYRLKHKHENVFKIKKIIESSETEDSFMMYKTSLDLPKLHDISSVGYPIKIDVCVIDEQALQKIIKTDKFLFKEVKLKSGTIVNVPFTKSNDLDLSLISRGMCSE